MALISVNAFRGSKPSASAISLVTPWMAVASGGDRDFGVYKPGSSFYRLSIVEFHDCRSDDASGFGVYAGGFHIEGVEFL